MSKIVNGAFWVFSKPVCCKISKKLKGDPLETLKSCRKKKRKMIILNSPIVTKNVEGGLWAFSTSLQLQNIKKIERGALWRQKNSKKSLIAPKKIERGTLWSHPVF